MRKIISVLLVLILAFAFSSCGKQDTQPLNEPDGTPILTEEEQQEKENAEEIQNSEDVQTAEAIYSDIDECTQLPAEAIEVIEEYFAVYYESIRNLEAQDMTYLFVKPDGEQAQINQNALELVCGGRKLKPVDLTLFGGGYHLSFTDCQASDSSASVLVLEDSTLKFNCSPDSESVMKNIKNYFTLKKTDDGYKISEYKKVQDFFVLETLNYSGGGKDELVSLKNKYLGIIEDAVSKGGDQLKDLSYTSEYNRSKAVEYANTYYTKKNPDWPYYDGSNCQNFACQCLNAGGIPMDKEGSATLYCDGSGVVQSWTYVPGFRDYVINNSGFGLVGQVDCDLRYAQPGDIVQVGVNAANRHTTIVTGLVEEDGVVKDVLLNSNTVNMKNFPLSAYVYPCYSLIHIFGYNE